MAMSMMSTGTTSQWKKELDIGSTEEESGDMSTHTYRDLSFKTPPISLDDFSSDVSISLSTDIAKDLEDDARELSEIDGMPAPPKITITGSTLSSSAIWEEPIYTSWASPTPTTVIIPAGTKFIQDPVTGELTNAEDIVVEI